MSEFNRAVVGKPVEPQLFSYTWKDVALYALSVGATADELDFLLDTAGPKVLPTYAVIPSFGAMGMALAPLGGDLLRVVHGEQRIVLHAPIPPSGTLKTTAVVSGLYDKIKMAQAIVETKTTDDKGKPLFDGTWVILFRGQGGFGGDRGPDSPSYHPPEGKAPDFRAEEKTLETQALLYRLNGDLNPIHANPEVAKMVGFARPILHGLCSFGYVGRALLRHGCGMDPAKMKSFEVRFSKIVLPGDTIVTEGWHSAKGEWIVRASTKERGEYVLTNSHADVAE